MRRDVMLELYKEQEITLPIFNVYADIKDNYNIIISQMSREFLVVANNIQHKFNDSNTSFNYYRELLSSIGILVFQTGTLPLNEMRGLSIFNEIFPIIVVNRKDEYNARIFSLFHELAHLITRTPGICGNFDMVEQSPFDVEIRCNNIAAEILLPLSELLADDNYIFLQKKEWDDNYVNKIARNFCVSRAVVIGRLLTAGRINRNFYVQKIQ
jgi:Zn-dependent peptidase ImmA (M78 family)